MAIFDSSGRLAECSAEFAQLLGESPVKLLGRAFEELPLSSGNRSLSLVREAQQTGKTASQDVTVGEAFLRVSAQPLVAREGGAHVAVTLMALAQAQAQRERMQQLELELARFRSLFENLPLICWSVRTDGSIEYLNRSWYTFTGLAPGPIELESWQQSVHPNDLPELMQRWSNSLTRGEPYEMDCRFHRHDGAWIWHRVRSFPMRDDDGSIYVWIGCSIDIQESRSAVDRAEEERRKSEEVRAALDTFFDAVPAGMALFDDKLRYTRINRSLAAMNGLSVDAHLGYTTRELFPVLDPHPDDFFRRILTTGETVTFESTGKSQASDEEGTWLQCTAPVRAPNGGPNLGVATVLLDISHRKRAEAERDRLIAALERSNKELDQFAYVASHDLKAPLRGINNLAQWIQDDLKSVMTDETREQMRLLTGRVHRMEALIDGILTYSRAGRAREQPESIDVAALLTETIELLSPTLPASIQIETRMPVLHTERVPLQQIFLNLISNGLKHAMRPDVLVKVRASETGDAWEFSIADNGPGIAPEYHDRIWGIFQTLRARDEVEGTGIGLAVVKKIVEARGGSVRLESAPDQGATFFFTWPKSNPKR